VVVQVALLMVSILILSRCYYIVVATAKQMSLEEVALGFLDVANEAMCRPIRQVICSSFLGYYAYKHPNVILLLRGL
jgi:hypothetical protein